MLGAVCDVSSGHEEGIWSPLVRVEDVPEVSLDLHQLVGLLVGLALQLLDHTLTFLHGGGRDHMTLHSKLRAIQLTLRVFMTAK